MSIDQDSCDNIVVGAGITGLTMASLLAQRQQKTILLEAHTVTGGCASYFTRKKFVFDVGATTLSGINGLDALKKIITLLQLDLKLKHCDPGLIIHYQNKTLKRFAHTDLWIEEQLRHFPYPWIKPLWQLIDKRKNEIYQLLKYASFFPIKKPADAYHLFQGDYGLKLKALFYLYQSFAKLHPQTSFDLTYQQILDEMLLIAAQNHAPKVPGLIGYLALTYLEDCWYCYGGMKEFNQQLVASFRRNEGLLYCHHEVLSIHKKNNLFEVKTAKKIFYAKKIFSTLPLWNTLSLASSLNPKKLHQQATDFKPQWGALTGYFSVKFIVEMQSLYHQIHLPSPISHTCSHSIFASFSPLDDTKRNDGTAQTLTLSVHIDLNHFQQALARCNRAELKMIWQKEFEHIIKQTFPGILELLCFGIADPLTFAFYTKRTMGTVGGIPHDVATSMLSYPNFDTGITNFFQMGDTTFPGQGCVGVIQGALNLYQRLNM